jgi:hypothetical protein
VHDLDAPAADRQPTPIVSIATDRSRLTWQQRKANRSDTVAGDYGSDFNLRT